MSEKKVDIQEKIGKISDFSIIRRTLYITQLQMWIIKYTTFIIVIYLYNVGFSATIRKMHQWNEKMYYSLLLLYMNQEVIIIIIIYTRK